MFSKNLKYLREKRGMEQLDLARRLGRKSASSVSYWERGVYTSKAGILADIANIFDVPLDALMSSDLTKEKKSKDTTKKVQTESHNYNFFDVGLSAGILTTVDPFKATDVKKITIPDLILGKYTGDNHLFITYINGESMNRILPDHSLIAVKEYDSVSDLKDSDIVAFEDSGEMCVKLFYKDFRSRTYSFMPSSTDPSFKPITYRWEEANQIKIVGKVVTYVVNI